jgi:hypothetical protein
MKRFLILTTLMLIGLPSIGRALDWYMVLDFSIPDPFAPNGALQSRMVLGIDPTADDQFNNQWDTIALPAGSLHTTFPHQEYLSSETYIPGSELLWRDIRGSGQPDHTWEIDVASDRFGTNTTLFWTLNTSNNQCQSTLITLTDVNRAVRIPISGNGSYTFPNGAVPTRLTVEAVQGISVAPPAPPTHLWSPRRGKDNLLLSWSSESEPNLLGFNVFRRTVNQSTFVQINSQPVTTMDYLDTDLTPGETYLYKATAVNTYGCSSEYSNEISITLN